MHLQSVIAKHRKYHKSVLEFPKILKTQKVKCKATYKCRPIVAYKRPTNFGGSHMRPRINFVLALHGECLHSNTYKMHLFVLKNIFRSQDSTLTYSTVVTIPALCFAYILSLI